MTKYKVLTDKLNTFFTNNKITLGTAAPTTGTHTAGDIMISSSANATAFGWICTVSGTPGTWKVLKSGSDVMSIEWGGITGKPSTYTPTIGTTSTTAFRGDYGNTAYNHSQQAHAPSNAQKNSDITKAEIEAKLTGSITSHTHNYLPLSGGTVTGALTTNGDIVMSTDKSALYMENSKHIYFKDKDGTSVPMMTINSANNLHIGSGVYDKDYDTGVTTLSGCAGLNSRTVSGDINFTVSKNSVGKVTTTGLAIGNLADTTYRSLNITRKCESNTDAAYAGSTLLFGVLNNDGGCAELRYEEGEASQSFRVYDNCVMFNGKRMFISTGEPAGTKSTGDIWIDI